MLFTYQSIFRAFTILTLRAASESKQCNVLLSGLNTDGWMFPALDGPHQGIFHLASTRLRECSRGGVHRGASRCVVVHIAVGEAVPMMALCTPPHYMVLGASVLHLP